MRVTVSDEVIKICSSGARGITKRGAMMLGVPYPLISGWKKKLLGRIADVRDDMIDDEQRPKLQKFRPDTPTGGNWKPVDPDNPVRPVDPPTPCRRCNALRAAGLEVGFDVADDVLAVQSLRSGKVTRMRGCDLNDDAGASTPVASVPLPSADGLRVEFIDGALQVTSERTGKVFRMSVQALHGLAKKAG